MMPGCCVCFQNPSISQQLLGAGKCQINCMDDFVLHIWTGVEPESINKKHCVFHTSLLGTGGGGVYLVPASSDNCSLI